MTTIPGWVYVILGVIMVLASNLIKEGDGSKPLIIFFWAGGLFIIIGVGKYVFKAVFKRDKQKTKPALHKKPVRPAQHTAHRTTHPYQYPQTQPQTSTHHKLTQLHGKHEVHRAQQPPHPTLIIISCPRCGTRHYSYANYCMRCGAKIK